MLCSAGGPAFRPEDALSMTAQPEFLSRRREKVSRTEEIRMSYHTRSILRTSKDNGFDGRQSSSGLSLRICARVSGFGVPAVLNLIYFLLPVMINSDTSDCTES